MSGQQARHEREVAARGRLARLRQAAVRVDSHPAVVTAVERLRRRAPGDARYGDGLSTSGKDPVGVVARGVSALEPDRPSALHAAGLGALQVWQSLSETTGRGRGTREVTLLFTDLVGFSSWALEAGDEAALELLREVGDVVEETCLSASGTIVKRLGDGVMAAFDEPDDAAEAALCAQDGLRGIEIAGHAPRMRAGAHRGSPRRIGGDYLGVDVNIAARVADGAKAGQVLVSEPTCAALDPERFATGRPRRLRAPGAPRDLRVLPVERAPR
jgi:adenylate cyclase